MIQADPGLTTFLFSPADDLATPAVSVVSAEQEEVCVLAYTLELVTMVAALKANHDKGLSQYVLADKSQFLETPEDKAALQELMAYGLDVLVGASMVDDQILHSKYVLGKSQTAVFSGSYNFSPSAQKESNASFLCQSGPVWAAFRADFDSKYTWVEQNVSQEPFRPSATPEMTLDPSLG